MLVIVLVVVVVWFAGAALVICLVAGAERAKRLSKEVENGEENEET